MSDTDPQPPPSDSRPPQPPSTITMSETSHGDQVELMEKPSLIGGTQTPEPGLENGGEEAEEERRIMERTVSIPKMSGSSAKESEDLGPTFPEGGTQAWLTVIGGALILFITFGAIQSFGIYQDFYTRVYLRGISPSDISWIGSTQAFLLFACSLPAGVAFDYGYLRQLLFFGTLLYIVCFVLLSLAKPHHFYQIFLSQGVGIGLAMGILFIPSLAIISHYFRKRRSTAMGVMFAGSSIGGIVYPIMLNNFFTNNPHIGFAWGVRITALIILVLAILSNLLMKTRLPNKRQNPNAETPDFKAILTDGGWWLLTIGGTFVFWGLFFPFFYLQLFSVLHGVPSTLAFYSITILNASSLFGRTLPNFLADRIGPFNTSIPMTFISGILVFAMLGVKTSAGMVIFAILYGFFSGGFISLIAADAGSFARSVSEVGTRVGISMFIAGFALLTGTPISGALLKAPKYEWWRPIVFSGVTVLFGACLMTIARSILVKRKGTGRV